jgi:hypothetical protein
MMTRHWSPKKLLKIITKRIVVDSGIDALEIFWKWNLWYYNIDGYNMPLMNGFEMNKDCQKV